MVNILGVEEFVNLWNKPDSVIVDILMGRRWNCLKDKGTRVDFYDIISKHAQTFYFAAKHNLKWLK